MPHSTEGRLRPGSHGKAGRAVWLGAPPREAADSLPPTGCPAPLPLIPVPAGVRAVSRAVVLAPSCR